MEETSIPRFPDSLYTEQAVYLAEHTPLTEREAEAYLRRAHIPDDASGNVLDRTLAEQMSGGGVSKGTFSTHLTNAREKLEGDAAALDAIKTLLLTTDFGGAGAPSRQVIGGGTTSNAFVLITETEFYDEEQYSFPDKYRAHLIYRENAPDIDFDALPENITHYTKYALFSVNSRDVDHLFESTLAYVDALDSLDAYDVINVADLLEDAFDTHVDHTDGDASAIVQDASGVIMEQSR